MVQFFAFAGRCLVFAALSRLALFRSYNSFSFWKISSSLLVRTTTTNTITTTNLQVDDYESTYQECSTLWLVLYKITERSYSRAPRPWIKIRNRGTILMKVLVKNTPTTHPNPHNTQFVDVPSIFMDLAYLAKKVQKNKSWMFFNTVCTITSG